MKNSYAHILITAFLFFISGDLLAQLQRVYADTETDGATTLSSVSNPTNAIDANLQTYSSLNVVILGSSWQQLKFTGADQPTPTTPVRIKMGTSASILTLLSGATVQAYNGTTAVGTAQTMGNIITLLDGGSTYEVVFTPGVAYNGVRITFGGVSLAGSINIYEAYFYKAATNINCNAAADEMHGINIVSPTIFIGSITNPLNAIDADLNTYAVVNATTGVTAYIHETILFSGLSVVGDSVRLTISTPTTLVPSQVLNSINVVTWVDNTSNNDAAANNALFNIRLVPGSTVKATITFAPANTFNRVELRLGGTTSTLSSINFYEGQRIVKAPVLTFTSSTICTGTTTTLSATVGSNTQIQWYSAASGGTLLNTGTSYTTPALTNTTTYYADAIRTGCTNTSDLLPDTVVIVGLSAVTPAARCGPGVVSLTAAAPTGTISWYTASTGGSALTTNTSYAPTLSATTNYFVASNVSQCAGVARTPVTATINTLTWAGTSTTNWSTLANWDCGSSTAMVPILTTNVTIPAAPTGGRFPTVSTTAPVQDITIATGASVTVSASGVFQIYGAISNSGTFTATSGTISMSGSAAQIIPAGAFSTNTIKNLIINNAFGVTLAGSLNLTGLYTPSSGVFTTGGYLTLKSDINGTAMVGAGSSNYITGSVNLERYIPASRSWRLMTAPVSSSNTLYQSWQNNGVYAAGKGMLVTAPGGGTGIDSSGFSSLKTWNKTTQLYESVLNTKVPISATSTGSADNTGYLVFVRGDRDPNNIDHSLIKKNITTLTSRGILQTGTQTFTNLSTGAGGFTLIGNPYASPVDVNLILANPGTSNIKRKFYVWDPHFNSVGAYVVLDDVLMSNVFAPTPLGSSQNNYMQSGQAFFTVTNTAGAAAIQFRETNKATTNNTLIFGRPQNDKESFIVNLFLTNSSDSTKILADGARADFSPAFSQNVDDQDNIKLTNIRETFGFLRDGQFLATERKTLDADDTLFLRINKYNLVSYQFQFIPGGFTDLITRAQLQDSYTNISMPISLSDTTTIDFVVNTDTLSRPLNRFRVVFSQEKPLAVFFTSIAAVRKNKRTMIEWQVEHEAGISKYEVERSGGGGIFNKINTTPVSSSTAQHKTYSIADADFLTGDNFYRIKSIGVDGKIQYSKTVKVGADAGEHGISVYPSPVQGRTMKLQFDHQPAGLYKIALHNSSGQLMLQTKLDHQDGNDRKDIRLPASVKPGNYELTIFYGNAEIRSLKVMVE